ncbi:MAG: hypothetical protein ACOC1O_06290, partial [bacterium]
IFTVIISLILGMLAVFVIQNYLVAEKIEFNTLGLLGFVLSILFAGASIVLAITAINLGKSSEQMMIDRSQKSIELQNEVYIKTTEALKKIEASTGVTEKRIEDIIAGRVGDIASRLVDDKIVTGKDREKLEHELRRSLSKELTAEEKKEREEQRRRMEEIAKQYDKFKEDTLLHLTNMENTKTLRVGDGSYRKSGVELLDGLFEINNTRIGICTFYSDPVYYDTFVSGVDEFLNNLAEEIAKNTFNKVVLAFNEISEITDKFNEEIEKIKNLYKPEIAEKIVLITGSPEEITKGIMNYVP